MRHKRKNHWEWIAAVLVGAFVTLICVLRQVSPMEVLFRVVFSVVAVAMIGKIAAWSIESLASIDVKRNGSS